MKGSRRLTRRDDVSKAIAYKVRCRAVVQRIASGQGTLLDEGMK